MWLFTKYGFYSIVEKDDGFHVRARQKRDLENLKDNFPEIFRVGDNEGSLRIQDWDLADYRFRIILPSKDRAVRLITNLARNIDYGNFKNAVKEQPGQIAKLSPLMQIWGIMQRLQPRPIVDLPGQEKFPWEETIDADPGF